MNLRKLFEPASIAVIGASRDPEKIGGAILANLRSARFAGKVYPVNPHTGSIKGLRCYPSVTEVSGTIEVAVIVIPAAAVSGALRECGKKRIPFVVVISAGFEEAGTEGKLRDIELQKIAKQYHISIVGPNCLGIINTYARMNASFSAAYPKRGGVSFVSQSGAIICSLIDWSLEAHVGLGTLVSLGNESGVSELDVLEYLAKDSRTTVIGMYLEEISDGPRFMRVVSRISRLKPIVILKAGISDAGQRAMVSHTGSLAGSDAVFSAILKQVGAIQVSDLEDLFRLMKLFSLKHHNASQDVMIVSNAGGPAIVAVDVLARTQLKLAKITTHTESLLRRVLPPGASVGNPLDLVGDADLPRFQKALRILAADRSFGNLYVIVTPQTITPLEPLARYVARLQRTSKKNMMVSFIGGTRVAPARRILAMHGVSHFNYPYDALRALSLSKNFYEPRRLFHPANFIATKKTPVRPMPYGRMQRLLKKYRFPFVAGRILKSKNDIDRIKKYPVAGKVLSSRAVHKFSAGGVALNIMDRTMARKAWDLFYRRFRGDGFEGILAQPMFYEGQELIIGMKRDAVMGIVIMVGIGGLLAEELHDISLRIGPVSPTDARAMLGELRHQQLIRGCDKEFVVRMIQRVSLLAEQNPLIQELDFNPVKILSKGGSIIDVRILENT